MPFIIAQASSVPIGKTLDAFFAGPNVNGEPDFRRRVPVQIKRLSEGALLILPDDRRVVISSTAEGGRTTFRIEPGHQACDAAVRHAQLAQCVSLANQRGGALLKLDPSETNGLRNALSIWLGSVQSDAQ